MSIPSDTLFLDVEFARIAHDPTATAYDTEGVIEVTPAQRICDAIAKVEAANAARQAPKSRPIPPPPSMRTGFAKGYTAEVNSPNSSRPKRRTPTGHRPSQGAPIGLVRTMASREDAKFREIDRMMRQVRS